MNSVIHNHRSGCLYISVMRYSLKRLITVNLESVSLKSLRFRILIIPWEVESFKAQKIVTLNKEQKAILIGMILGDAYLQITGKRNARLRLEHGIKQKEYLLWKANKFPQLFQGQPKYLERQHPVTGRIYQYCRHQSNANSELGRWRLWFYQDGKKKIPEDLIDYLKDPLSLAVWYMDDGYYYDRDRVSYLYLGKAMKAEAEIASETITRNFGIKSKILDKKKKGFALYFFPHETLKLHNLLKKYIIPSLNYKINQSP